jgi:hypothetical protein
MSNYYVKITNLNNTSMYWEGYFNTMDEAKDWRDEQVLLERRNIDEQWFKEELLSDAQISTATDQRLIEFEPDTYYKEYLIPAEAEASIYNLTEVRARENLKNSRKRKGFVLRDLAQNILNIATGYFYDQNLTVQQVAGLKSTYPEVFTFLSENMPITAKAYIDLMPIEGLITQELIDDINSEYDSYKELFPDIVIF